ncbi:helix-turn-helix domain-containing protein [Rhodococcus rhodnii]|uniref:HTH cro/C1-type domain-containing protein n=1 Tax=Rhodococcus rhodnii LMG 5362 TaxID=1273125 RepID=R7WU17_9NOCA|nr:helix-turn-helix transcriptional regulator [Rhodococcus rhodnii]EOM77649.1 hypothetical protein Rrhod_0968 [Rhodococcus rhodnii LMG 5362]
MPTLADLIAARKAERGWSYQQLADRVEGAISRQRWQQLGTGVRIKEFPEPATIQAIADALEVDVTLVVLAVARSIGFSVRRQESALAAMLPPGADQLTEEQRDAVLAVVRVMAPRQPSGATNEEVPEPRPEASGTVDSSQGSGDRPRRSPPMNDGKVTALPSRDQAPEPDERPQRLAARHVKGGSKEKQRRRAETAPEDQSQDEGPEGGA